MDIHQVEEFLRKEMNALPLFATQSKISGPKILKNLQRLANGDSPPPISVADNLVIEGHHRYVAGHIFGTLPEMQPGSKPTYVNRYRWSDLQVDPMDWDNP
jgi:hypothetical protein